MCRHEVRGQPHFETRPLYHFMFVEKEGCQPGSRPAGIYGLTNSWGSPPCEYHILLVNEYIMGS